MEDEEVDTAIADNDKEKDNFEVEFKPSCRVHMYSTLKEASCPLFFDDKYSDIKFNKSGTYNANNLKHNTSRKSFFLWKISDKIFEIFEITSSKQLKNNRFIYNFAINQNNNSNNFYLQSEIEFIEYENNGQNMISVYLIASNWKLYKFEIFHPHEYNKFNSNVSVLHNLQQTEPFEYSLISNTNRNELEFNNNTSFKLLDKYKILLCSSNKLFIINMNNNNNIFLINETKQPNINTNALSLFQSFLPSQLISNNNNNNNSFNYIFMNYYKPITSRTIIGCLNNVNELELYLLGNNNQIFDKQILSLNNEIGNKLLFYQYKYSNGMCWFTIIIFINSGGGLTLQCQYKQTENKIYILNEVNQNELFKPINNINNKLCIYSQIYNNILYCCLTDIGNNMNNNSNNNNNYDIYFCNIKHYLNIKHNSTKWKFQRMWKRQEYINRILDSIKNEFNFDIFYNYLLLLNIYNLTNSEEYKQKLHEIILNFWLTRYVDDPTLELNQFILNKQLNYIIIKENIKQLQPHWTVSDIQTFGIFNNKNDDENIYKINNNNNQTMTRIKFEAKLQTLMIAIMDKNLDKKIRNDLNKIQTKEYIFNVWEQYKHFFNDCISKSKEYKKFIGFSVINNINSNNKTIVIIKDNGFSIIRDMDYSEQIEVYFDRYAEDINNTLNTPDENELNDTFSEPPIRLHKFIGFCHNGNNININKQNIYHWFVACTWFYYQNNNIFNLINEQQIISKHTFYQYFEKFINKNNSNIKRHTKKHIKHLYEIQSIDFLKDIINMFIPNDSFDSEYKDDMKDAMDQDDDIDNRDDGHGAFNIDNGLMGCVESSFSSIVAARYSLLKSIYITFLYIYIELDIEIDPEMMELSNLLCGYFILSYLSSCIYEPKQYLGLSNYNNYNISESLLSKQAVSTTKRYELLSNLQSSFKCGLSVGHYLRYKRNISLINDCNENYMYLESSLLYINKLINVMFVNNNYIDLIYNIIEFMFYERQFESLQKILSYVQHISPLFNYLLARCYIEVDQKKQIKNKNKNENENGNGNDNEIDEHVIDLINECGKYLNKLSPDNIKHEKEKYLLGLILTINDYGNNSEIDIYNLAPKDIITFPKEFIINRKKNNNIKTIVSFNHAIDTQYEWSIILSYYFHIIHLYKNVLLKSKIVIKFAKQGIELIKDIQKHMNINDDDDDHKYNEKDMINRIRKYSGINEKRAKFLCFRFNGNLELILLSIYKSNFILEIVCESLKMEKYKIAYEYLITFDDYFCAKQGIKEYVNICCKNKKMEPILNEKWDESIIQFTEWRKYLLTFKKSTNISLKVLNYKNFVELIIYNKFALQFNIEDSFCYDLLYTFSMNNKEYQFAAKYMFEYAIKIQQYISNKTKSTQILQYHCICHVLSAMDLIKNKTKKYLLLDFKININDLIGGENNIFNNNKIITYKEIKKWYILLQSKNYLLSLHINNNLTDENIADLNVVQTADHLYTNGYYEQALLLLYIFDINLMNIFNKIIKVLLFGSDINDEENNNDELNWNIFEQLLIDYDSINNHYKYTLESLEIILNSNKEQKEFIMPSFIDNKMQNLSDKEIDVFIIPLIELLCKFGKIFESLRILFFALNLTQVSIKNNQYNYQNHSLWKISQKLYAYCNTLQLKNEQNTLMKSLANWIARPQ